MRNLVYIPLILFCLVQSACVSAYRAPDANFNSCGEYADATQLSAGIGQHMLRAELLPVSRSDTSPSTELDFEVFNQTLAARAADLNTRPLIVRYSEGGDLVSRCDYSLALGAIKNAAPDKKLTVLIYVHGWNNDAGPADDRIYNYREYDRSSEGCTILGESGGDYCNFEKLLREMRTALPADEAAIGIYLSWKGSTPLPYLDYFGRRSGADKLARGHQLPKLLGAAENLRRQRRDTKLIYLGHSMGARILYNAMAPDLIRSTQGAYPEDDTRCLAGREPSAECTYSEIAPKADLVVLINPAFEAASYKAIDDFRSQRLFFENSQPPLMITLQSAEDQATKTAFAFAEGIGLLNDPGQSRLRRISVGHYEPFHTHKLAVDTACRNASGDNGKSQTRATLLDFCAAGMNLSRINREPWAKSPFIVAHVDKDSMPGHSWFPSSGADTAENRLFNDWLSAFIRGIPTFHEQEYSRAIVRAAIAAFFEFGGKRPSSIDEVDTDDDADGVTDAEDPDFEEDR